MNDAIADYKAYTRIQVGWLRPYVPGEDLTGVSIANADRADGSPKLGDMIARNDKNHDDKWLVSAAYFAENYDTTPSAGAAKKTRRPQGKKSAQKRRTPQKSRPRRKRRS